MCHSLDVDQALDGEEGKHTERHRVDLGTLDLSHDAAVFLDVHDTLDGKKSTVQ